MQDSLQDSASPSSDSARPSGRDTTGRFTAGNALGQRFEKGNTAALVHGGRRLQVGSGTVLDEAERVAIRAAVLEDLGGEAEVSAVMLELVSDFSAAVVLRDLCYAHIAAVGPLTQAGRRRAVVGLYLDASARVERLAARIGTGKRARRVPSIAEALAGKKVEAS